MESLLFVYLFVYLCDMVKKRASFTIREELRTALQRDAEKQKPKKTLSQYLEAVVEDYAKSNRIKA